MQYNQISNTDLSVSAIGLGTWVFGGELWGGSKEDDCLQAVDAALDSGINLIDTAPIYGQGKSEEIIGKAIKGKRDGVIIATKCGLASKGGQIVHNLTAQSISDEVDQSLKRLRIDYIDLYQCHWPDPNTPLEETFEALQKLKSNEKIRYIGVSNFDLDLLKRSKELADVITLQSEYSLLQGSLEKEIIPYCLEAEIGILSYGTLGGGILSGKYKQEPKFKGADARNFFYKNYKGERFEKVKNFVTMLETLNRPTNETALNWVRQQKSVVSTLVGCRNADQVFRNVKAADWTLTEEELNQISAIEI